MNGEHSFNWIAERSVTCRVAICLACLFLAAMELFLAPVVSAAPPDRADLNRQLMDRYRGKVLFLQHAFTDGSQEYDAGGILLRKSAEGAWSLFGQMVVLKIDANLKELSVQGKRAYYPGGSPQPDDVKISIRLAGPLASTDEADAALARVFALSSEEKVKSAPPYWREYLANQLRIKIPKGSAFEDTDPNLVDALSYHCESQPIPPKPLSMRDPDFSMAARRAKYGGIVNLTLVVNTQGKVSSVSIVKPLGMGLDENAVMSVYGWRFAPGTCNGKPLSMKLFSEVNFQLQ